MHGLETVPQVPSVLHLRLGLPVYVSSHEVTVTVTADAPVAVMGQDAKPSTEPDAVLLQKSSGWGSARPCSSMVR